MKTEEEQREYKLQYHYSKNRKCTCGLPISNNAFYCSKCGNDSRIGKKNKTGRIIVECSTVGCSETMERSRKANTNFRCFECKRKQHIKYNSDRKIKSKLST